MWSTGIEARGLVLVGDDVVGLERVTGHVVSSSERRMITEQQSAVDLAEFNVQLAVADFTIACRNATTKPELASLLRRLEQMVLMLRAVELSVIEKGATL